MNLYTGYNLKSKEWQTLQGNSIGTLFMHESQYQFPVKLHKCAVFFLNGFKYFSISLLQFEHFPC